MGIRLDADQPVAGCLGQQFTMAGKHVPDSVTGGHFLSQLSARFGQGDYFAIRPGHVLLKMGALAHHARANHG